MPALCFTSLTTYEEIWSMAIADSIMTGVRQARQNPAAQGKMSAMDAEKIVLGLRQQIPSLRNDNGVKQLRQCIDKLAKTKQINESELAILRSATDGDPARMEAMPQVRTHQAEDHGLDSRYAIRFMGNSKPGEEGYQATRQKLMQCYNDACQKHDAPAALRWRDLVEGLDHRFHKAAQADNATLVDERLDVDAREHGHWQPLPVIRARAFGRAEPKSAVEK